MLERVGKYIALRWLGWVGWAWMGLGMLVLAGLGLDTWACIIGPICGHRPIESLLLLPLPLLHGTLRSEYPHRVTNS
jgi:hypothetical protein